MTLLVFLKKSAEASITSMAVLSWLNPQMSIISIIIAARPRTILPTRNPSAVYAAADVSDDPFGMVPLISIYSKTQTPVPTKRLS